MSNSEDRRRADWYELDLRRKAELDPGNCWELIWFLGLPLEVRCSYMRILEARIDQASTREYFFRQASYHRRNWREQEVPCMLIETVKQGPKSPWGSIGRRQSRKSAASSPSKAQGTRAKATVTTTASRPPPVPATRHCPSVSRRYDLPSRSRTAREPCKVQSRPSPKAPRPRGHRIPSTENSLPPAPMVPAQSISHQWIPRRPPTPDGLREAFRSAQPLSIHALGYDPITLDDGRCSPAPPVTPPAVPVYPPGPLYPSEPRYRIDGVRVKHTLAFVIASGRTHMEPWKVRELPIADATFDIRDFDQECPGVLSDIARILFPSGPNNLTAAVPATRLILDLIVGWLILPSARMRGWMPPPWQKCSCGEGVVVCW